MRDYPHPRIPYVKEGGIRMENKTKILTFAAVALMFAVCFIGFVAISGDAVDADEGATTTVKKSIEGMYTGTMELKGDEGSKYYELTSDVTVTLTSDVTLTGIKFADKAGEHTLTITSASEKRYTLTVNYDFGTKTDEVAGNIFGVSNFVLNGADLNVIQKDTGKTEGPKSNQAGCSVFGTGSVEVKGTSEMKITTNEFANRVFYNNGSSLKIDGLTAKVILERASSSTVSLSMTNGATLEIKDPLKTAGNFYPKINNTGNKCNITVTGAADGNHGLFFYGSNSNATDATAGVLKNCTVETDGIVGFYSNGSVDATGSTFEAKELVVAKSSAAEMANVKGATFNVAKVGALNPNDGYKPVNDKKLYLEDVTFEGNVEIESVANVTIVSKLSLKGTTTISVKGTITGGEIDITGVDKGVKCIIVNENGVLNTIVNGTVKDTTDSRKDIKSVVVLDNVVAGANGITIEKGSVIVDGIIKTGDVTIPAGSTSFVYGTLESGSKLKVESGASVNTGGTGILVIESGAEVESVGAITSVIYKAGSKLNDVAFEKDTKYTSDGEVKVSIRIYFNYDSNKLYVSKPYVDAFANDDYRNVLSDVYVEGVNKRITFTGWYNTLNEKIVSGVIVPDVTEDIILSAHFDEVAKQIPAKVDSDNGNDVNDYSLVIAFVVLVASLGFLACVIKKR